MAMPGMITFGLLVLIDCLNGQNIPTHPDPVVIKVKGRSAVITCNVDSSTLQSTALHWYRVQPGGAFQRLMYFESKSAKATIEPDIPRRFAGSVKNQQVSLTVTKVQFDDAGSYYCALWTGDKSWIKRFGTGTRLIVTESGKDTIQKPTITAYLPIKKQSGKQTMLCQATDMFPDLVKFTWQKKINDGAWTEVSEDNVVEQRNESPVTVTSILILDQNTAGKDLYQCTVTHEGNKTPDYKVLQNVNKDPAEKSDYAVADLTCSTPNNETLTNQISGSSESEIASLYLFVYAYGVMLMKNGVYFCAVFIFVLKRKVGKKEESS